MKEDVLESSIRQKLVLQILKDKFPKRGACPLPLAAKINEDNKDLIVWLSSSTVLGGIEKNKLFSLKQQCLCQKLNINERTAKVEGADILNLETGKRETIKAKIYIVFSRSIFTPQLLYVSGLRGSKPKRPLTDPPQFIGPEENLPEHLKLRALVGWFPYVSLEHKMVLIGRPMRQGQYLTEQTMCFCQVVLKEQSIKAVRDPKYNPYPDDESRHHHWAPLKKRWKNKVNDHKKATKKMDPVPFPFNDLDLQVPLPLTEENPWHTQIHRDAFSYGVVTLVIDKRTIVDLRYFGLVESVFDNYVTFEDDVQDAYGMP